MPKAGVICCVHTCTGSISKHHLRKASGLTHTAGLADWVWGPGEEEMCPWPHGLAAASLPGGSVLRPSGLGLDWANLICSPQEQSPGHQNPLLMSCRDQTPTRETPEPLRPSRPLSCQEWSACPAAKGRPGRQGCGCAGVHVNGPDPKTSERGGL